MLFELLTAPAEKFIDPSERVFWGYLLSALVIASFVVAHQEQRFNPIEQLRRLFNPKYWLSRSSLYDMFLLIFNTIMRLTLIIPFLVATWWLLFWWVGSCKNILEMHLT